VNGFVQDVVSEVVGSDVKYMFTGEVNPDTLNVPVACEVTGSGGVLVYEFNDINMGLELVSKNAPNSITSDFVFLINDPLAKGIEIDCDYSNTPVETVVTSQLTKVTFGIDTTLSLPENMDIKCSVTDNDGNVIEVDYGNFVNGPEVTGIISPTHIYEAYTFTSSTGVSAECEMGGSIIKKSVEKNGDTFSVYILEHIIEYSLVNDHTIICSVTDDSELSTTIVLDIYGIKAVVCTHDGTQNRIEADFATTSNYKYLIIKCTYDGTEIFNSSDDSINTLFDAGFQFESCIVRDKSEGNTLTTFNLMGQTYFGYFGYTDVNFWGETNQVDEAEVTCDISTASDVKLISDTTFTVMYTKNDYRASGGNHMIQQIYLSGITGNVETVITANIATNVCSAADIGTDITGSCYVVKTGTYNQFFDMMPEINDIFGTKYEIITNTNVTRDNCVLTFDINYDSGFGDLYDNKNIICAAHYVDNFNYNYYPFTNSNYRIVSSRRLLRINKTPQQETATSSSRALVVAAPVVKQDTFKLTIEVDENGDVLIESNEFVDTRVGMDVPTERPTTTTTTTTTNSMSLVIGVAALSMVAIGALLVVVGMKRRSQVTTPTPTPTQTPTPTPIVADV